PVPQPHNSAVSGDGHLAYVGSQQQGATAIVIVDLVRLTQVDKVPLEKTPRALALSQDGTQLYVTLAGVDAVQVVDVANKRVVAQLPVGASPPQPLVSPAVPFGLAVSQGPGTLEFLDLMHRTVSATVQVGKAP